MVLALLKACESDGFGKDLSAEQKIHAHALLVAENFKRSEVDLIDALMSVDRERVFLKLGYPSLFKYAVEALKLSEATAFNFITVVRKSREVPELRASIARGALSVSKAKKIAAVLTSANQDEWLKKAEILTSRQLEKEVARENPRLATPERATYVNGKRLQLQLGIEEALMLRLRQAQDQVSRSRNRTATLEDTLQELVEFYLKHKDPVERAKRVIAKKGTGHVNRELTAKVGIPGRTPIPAAIAHQVRVRDQGQCQSRVSEDASICGSRRWVDLHHIQPVSLGGGNTADNLIIMCRSHHQELHHRRGEGKM